jgi:ABC-type uncharacterized transport system substrate-binding protein
MKILKIMLMAVVLIFLNWPAQAQVKKLRVFVVSSYHKDYLWEVENNEGFCAGLLDFKFLDNKAQADAFTLNDYVETDKLVLKKAWLDSKRKNTKNEMQQSALGILAQIEAFKPDLILTGDDNASNYIGTQFIDKNIPVIFRGIIGTPVKYGLAESIEHPGHNITGILKNGYPKDTIEYFLKLVPNAKTFAILGDASETSRGKAKRITQLIDSGKVSLKLVDTVLTNSYTEWKNAVSKLQNKVDAFFFVNHNTIKDDNGASVDPFEVMSWYLQNIKKPEMSGEKQFVLEGALMTVDDSAYKQSYEQVRLMDMVIHEKKNPADIPCVLPERGKFIVNRERAQMLGIDLSGKGFIEQYVDKASSMEKYPPK